MKLFVFLGGDSPGESEVLKKKIEEPCVSGVQVIYSWKELEPQKDDYDFSRIDRDLAYLNAHHKKLFIQLQDQSFLPDVINVPEYI